MLVVFTQVKVEKHINEVDSKMDEVESEIKDINCTNDTDNDILENLSYY